MGTYVHPHSLRSTFDVYYDKKQTKKTNKESLTSNFLNAPKKNDIGTCPDMSRYHFSTAFLVVIALTKTTATTKPNSLSYKYRTIVWKVCRKRLLKSKSIARFIKITGTIIGILCDMRETPLLLCSTDSAVCQSTLKGSFDNSLVEQIWQ